jgi:hypothetical protein
MIEESKGAIFFFKFTNELPFNVVIGYPKYSSGAFLSASGVII